MKLIFAQGNPGPEYASSRHNIGFLVLDNFRAEHDLPDFKLKTKFQAEITELEHSGEKIILAKPQTFYNQTGVSARAIADFYQITPENILVIHDELALDFGKIRIRQGGSDAGNNGIKSLNSHLGPSFWHLKIGIKNPQKELMNDADFVLGKLTPEEKSTLEKSIYPATSQIINQFIKGELEITSLQV